MWNKVERRVLSLDEEEHGIVVNALNEMRIHQMQEQQETDVVDDLLLKTIDAPTKKEKRRLNRESR